MIFTYKKIPKGVFSALVFILTLTFSVSVAAHVKWFTEEEAVKAPITEIITPLFIILSILIAVGLGLLTQLAPKLMEWPKAQKIDNALASWKNYTPHILRIGVAIALVIQIIFDSILAPEIALTNLNMVIGILIALILLFPFRITKRIAALGLLYLFIDAFLHIGWFHMLDYAFYLAIIFALVVQDSKYKDLGTPALYLGTGLSLCWVAVEKWVYPGMSINIIENHHVPTFGFDAYTFILLSAFIEFVVGYLLVVGILNRLLALVLTLIFVMTTTLFGIVEIAGHFIVHVILLIFIIEGLGFYKPPIEMHQRKHDQVIFVTLNFIFVLATILLIYYRFA